jgi:hypothetical protein
MEHRIRVSFGSTAFIVSVAVAASVITSVVIASRAYRSNAELSNRREQTIDVRGSARKRIRSDLAVWQISVKGEGKELTEAYGPLKSGVESVQRFLSERGFSASEVSIGAIDTKTRFARDKEGHATDEVTGYILTRSITVTTPEVDRVDTSAGAVTELIQEGIAVISHAPEYYITQVSALKIEMLGEASQDARARADEIVVNAGGRVGEVRKVHAGVMQITRPNSTDVSAGGIYDTTTIEKDVMAVVTLTLALEGS